MEGTMASYRTSGVIYVCIHTVSTDDGHEFARIVNLLKRNHFKVIIRSRNINKAIKPPFVVDVYEVLGGNDPIALLQKEKLLAG